MSGIPRVAILGGGHAAFAHAADLSLRGVEVRLFELPALAEALAEVQRLGGIESQPQPSTGLGGGFGRLALVTANAAEALAGADVAFLVVPAFAHRAFAQAIALHVTPQQIIVLSPGSFGGAVLFARALREAGCDRLPALCEAESMIYACRKIGPASVTISGFKERLRVAVFPGRMTDNVMQTLCQVFPNLEAVESVLWTWLSNANPVSHPSITILNAGWIEQAGGDFLFYLEGETPSVRRVVDVLDGERMAVGAAAGLQLTPNRELSELWYGHQARRVGGGRMPGEVVYANIKAEPQLESRYLTEDIPFGLVPWEDLGRLVGVATPLCTALIDLGDVLLGRDFRQDGLTLARIGLGDLTLDQLRAYLETGEGQAADLR